MRNTFFLWSLLALAACKGDDTDTSDTDTDADTDADTDSDTDADTDSDTDSDTDTDTDVGGPCTLSADLTTLTTRQVATFTVTQDDTDVTGSATFTTGDADVLNVYTAPIGQPIDEGTVTITADVDGVTCDLELTVSLAAAGAGDLAINEFLADGGVDGDPNGDGTSDETEDEFLEIYNASDVTVDLDGVLISEDDFPSLPRHTFPPGTVLHAGEVIVVFGGGDTSALVEANAWFQVAQNDDPGVQFGLNLNDDGDIVTIWAADGTTEISALAYGTRDSTVPVGADQSTTRSPDGTGTSFVVHTAATGAVGNYSLGTEVSGASFPGYDGIYAP